MQRVWVLNLSLKFELLFESFNHIFTYIKPKKRHLSKTMTKEKNHFAMLCIVMLQYLFNVQQHQFNMGIKDTFDV